MGKIIEVLIILVVTVVAVMAVYFKRMPEVSVETLAVKKPQEQPETFLLTVNPQQAINVGILGESWQEEENKPPFNETILKQLFHVLEENHVLAIFFTGNLISGKETKSDNVMDINGETFQKQLEQFTTLFNATFAGKEVHLFPIAGSREVANPEFVPIFQRLFHLEGAAPFEEGKFGYTVSIGDAFFAVISTNNGKGDQGSSVGFSLEMQKWLKKVLKKAKDTHKYLFVIGHEPAFYTAPAYTNMDIGLRDSFWQILIDNGVLAYFASHEHLFDRSKRRGVWQIISGGGGASSNDQEERQPFFHTLVLTIPASSKEEPTVKAIDTRGIVGDTIELTGSEGPIYQFHISGP